MHKLYVFWHLDWKERFLLPEALSVVVAIRLGLSLLPFRTLRSLVHLAGQHPIFLRKANALPVERIVWTVRAVSEYVPGATCLTQALAGQVLLARRGHPAHLHIGVTKSSSEGLDAHAWLECDGQIVLGDQGGLAAYAPFPSLE